MKLSFSKKKLNKKFIDKPFYFLIFPLQKNDPPVLSSCLHPSQQAGRTRRSRGETTFKKLYFNYLVSVSPLLKYLKQPVHIFQSVFKGNR